MKHAECTTQKKWWPTQTVVEMMTTASESVNRRNLTKEMAGNNAELPELPSTESDIMEERIMARRFRIQKRQEDIMRPIKVEEIKTEPILHPSKSEQQITQSDQFLVKARHDTSILVANIRKAAIIEEKCRKKVSNEINQRRIEQLEEEANIGTLKFKEISSKWHKISQLHAPSELHEKLEEQKQACDVVIAEKDILIQQLKEEINHKVLLYNNNIEREEDEVQMTIERARQQIDLLSSLYTKELNSIEDSLFNELKELFETQIKDWEESLSDINNKGKERRQLAQNVFKKCEQELDELRRLKAEEYQKLRAELETDVQILEQYLQQMKAQLQLNQEKLEYGYQVLKKRDEEQVSVRAQQKRKLTKLQDVCATLKSKIEKAEKLSREKKCREEEHCTKSGYKIQDLYKKLRHFRVADEQKFRDLWTMNDEHARNLVQELLSIDKDITERILRLPWERPVLFFEEDSRKRFSNATAKKLASLSAPVRRKIRSPRFLFEIGLMAVRSRSTPSNRHQTHDDTEITTEIRTNILKTLADEASFLVERRKETFTTNLPDREQILINLDGILSALNIEQENEIEDLIRLLYKRCYRCLPDCSSKHETTAPVSDEESSAVTLPQLDEAHKSKDPLMKEQGDYEKINAALILPTVDEFLEKRGKRLRSTRNVQTCKPFDGYQQLEEQEIKAYWHQYFDIIPSSRYQLWENLLQGLEKFRETEAERAKLRQENYTLHKQNNELKTLLSQYLRSRAMA